MELGLMREEERREMGRQHEAEASGSEGGTGTAEGGGEEGDGKAA